jgi:hypothetical protein
MANMTKELSLGELTVKLNALTDDCNKAIAEDKLTDNMLSKFKELEKAYAKAKTKIVYDELIADTKYKPLIAAIKKHYYPVLRHSVVREDGKTTEIRLEEKQTQIKLLKFAEYADLDTDWKYDADELNQALCLRAAQELGFSPAEIKEVAKTKYMLRKTKEMAEGKTPTSNTALCKAIQKVIDAALPSEDETTGNPYKCNNRDLGYMTMCYTKKGRTALSVAVVRGSAIIDLVMDVMHRIVEGKVYTLEYRMVKKDAADAKPADKPANKAESKKSATKKPANKTGKKDKKADKAKKAA